MRGVVVCSLALFACAPSAGDGGAADPDLGAPPLPPRAVCGNGVVEVDEACDDGNDDPTDACNGCQPAACGDGVLRADLTEGEDGWEQCDDGNVFEDDGCRSDCRAARCGDGVLDEGERCDDGNEDDTDHCRSDCRPARCGDEIVNGDEACDDSNGVDTDACTNACEVAVCGDGIVWAGAEDCDGAQGCRDDCTLPACGDARVDDGEACDDGNERDTDGCTTECREAFCGDGLVREGVEECDGEAGCRADCTLPACGDGIVDGGEDCDDANDADDDACTNACADAVCGDGILRVDVAFGEAGWEGCDAPDDPDRCDADCVPLRCGDGVVDPEEGCDDGDQDERDACTNACRPAACGDGVLREDLEVGDEGFEVCDDGNDRDEDACLSDCTVAACGDGFVNAGVEQCDDGNLEPGDGCDGECRSERPVALREVPLAAGWASVRSNFHPQSACFDAPTGNVALMIQSRREIVLVDPATGLRAGQVPLVDYQHAVGVACDADAFHFTDYTANGGGPDLFRASRQGPPIVQTSNGRAAFGGFPLTVHGERMWRANDSNRYDWTPLTQLRVSTKEAPDVLIDQLQVAIPEGIGDLCHDGVALWVLGNVPEGNPVPGANLYRVDAESGQITEAYPGFYECENGRPAGLACEGPRGWLFCFNEDAQAPGGLVELRLPVGEACVDCFECGDGEVEGEEACDDGNQEAGDGCSPECEVEVREGAPVLVGEVALAAAWVGQHSNFHPQGAAYDAETGAVVLALQGRRRLDYVDPATGALDGGTPLPEHSHVVSVGVWGGRFVFSDYTSNGNGPDLLAVPRDGGSVVQQSPETDAFAGYPLTVFGDTIWRGVATPGYDWRGMRTIRVASMVDPDQIERRFEVPADVGDLCFDGVSLWVLGYEHEGPEASPDVSLYQVDPNTGALRVAFEGLYRCRTGRPAGLACDGDRARGWVVCYDEDGGDGTLAEFALNGCDEGCEPPEPPEPPEAPELVGEVATDAAWSGAHNNFHPQGACYDRASGRVVLMLQGRRRLDFVDPATGGLAGGLALDAYGHGVGVACGDAAFYFSDYSGNAGGPDLFRVAADNAAEQIGAGVAAFGGFPLAVDGGTMWRGGDSLEYDWSVLRSVRVSPVDAPDDIDAVLEVDVPMGIGDLCHDGAGLWALGYVHDEAPVPEADLYLLDPATGERRGVYEGVYRCARGRPAGLACDGEAARLWIFCYDEGEGDGVLAELRLAQTEVRRGRPELVGAVDLDAEWAGVHGNFHPQGACYDAPSGDVAVALQGRQRIDLVDPATGQLAGGVALGVDYNHATGVGCDADTFYFADYSGNRGGPDLFSLPRGGGEVAQISEAVAAYGGFPLAVHGDLMFRANDSQRYGWGDLQRVRVSSKATPDMVRVAYEAPVPTGIGDLCHDGDTLWALAYAHDPGGSPEASIIGMAPETGELRATHDAFYRCPRGLPSAWACDGETGRAWLLCYAGGGQRGVLAEFEMGLGR